MTSNVSRGATLTYHYNTHLAL